MSELIQSIKELAHKISEDYLLLNKNINNSIISAYQNGEIGNDEILKRICELVNQNVYISLFNDPSINKAHIIFDIAEFNKIIPIIRESEKAMNTLNAPPTDFRTAITSSPSSVAKIAPAQTYQGDEVGEDQSESPDLITGPEKQAELNMLIQHRNTYKNLLDSVETMKCAEEKYAEEAFNVMAHDAKILVAKGESLGDLTKLAARSVEEIGKDYMIKVGMAYDLIHKELVKSGFFVNTEFTKISSMRINPNSEILSPVKHLVLSISKIAAFNEMSQNITKIINACDKIIKNEMKK